MTYAEIVRYANAYMKRREYDLKEQAIMDYIHAGLVLQGLGGKMPSIAKAYPQLFKEEQQQESINNFINFANAWNEKFEKGNNNE